MCVVSVGRINRTTNWHRGQHQKKPHRRRKNKETKRQETVEENQDRGDETREKEEG